MPDKSEEEEIDNQVSQEFNDEPKEPDLFSARQPQLPILTPTPQAEPAAQAQGPVVVPLQMAPAKTYLGPPNEKPARPPPVHTKHQPDLPPSRTLRDRGNIHARPKFADEFAGIGSKKT